jgi:hypothetical protein
MLLFKRLEEGYTSLEPRNLINMGTEERIAECPLPARDFQPVQAARARVLRAALINT